MSAPPFDTLNLGFHMGDRSERVLENRARFAGALGVPLDRFYEQRQVHGSRCREISPNDVASSVADDEGDALVVRHAGVAVAARTADCVPILLAHPPTGDVAAVHAGWRGAVAGVVGRAIDAMSCPPAELVAAIGPHIRTGAFEIGEEVAKEMEAAAGRRGVVDRSKAKPHGDLARLVALQLLDAGLPADSVDDVGGCTYSEPALFFSHRREGGETGRHLSAVVARDSASC